MIYGDDDNGDDTMTTPTKNNRKRSKRLSLLITIIQPRLRSAAPRSASPRHTHKSKSEHDQQDRQDHVIRRLSSTAATTAHHNHQHQKTREKRYPCVRHLDSIHCLSVTLQFLFGITLRKAASLNFGAVHPLTWRLAGGVPRAAHSDYAAHMDHRIAKVSPVRPQAPTPKKRGVPVTSCLFVLPKPLLGA